MRNNRQRRVDLPVDWDRVRRCHRAESCADEAANVMSGPGLATHSYKAVIFGIICRSVAGLVGAADPTSGLRQQEPVGGR